MIKRKLKKILAVFVTATMLLGSAPNLTAGATASPSDATPMDSTTEITIETTEEVTTTETTENGGISTVGILGGLTTPPLNGDIGDSGQEVTAYKTGAYWKDYASASVSGSYVFDSHSFINITDQVNTTIGYCMEANEASPNNNEYNEDQINAGSTPYPAQASASSVFATFGYGGSYSDPNADLWGGTWNDQDGGSYGTYLVSSGNGVRAVRGLLIEGEVFELTPYEARIVTGLAVHAVANGGEGGAYQLISSLSAKDTSESNSGHDLWTPYVRLTNLGLIAQSEYASEAGYSGANAISGSKYDASAMAKIGNEFDNTSFYEPTQKFTWTIYNAKTGNWDAYTNTDNLSEDYVKADGTIEIKVNYTAYNMCSNLQGATESTTNMTVTPSSAFSINGETHNYSYFRVIEGTGSTIDTVHDTDLGIHSVSTKANNVPFEVKFGDIYTETEDCTKNITFYNGINHFNGVNDSAYNIIEADRTRYYFKQDATITLKAKDLKKKDAVFSVGVKTETGTTRAEAVDSSGKLSVRFFEDVAGSYQDIFVLNPSRTITNCSAIYAEMEGSGYAYLKKEITDADLIAGNSNYSKAGCEYKIYSGTNTNGTALVTLTTEDNGNTKTISLPYGTYTAVETKAGPGLKLNSTPITFTLTVDHTENNPYIINASDPPILGSIQVYKESDNPGMTKDNDCYDLKATYELRDSAGVLVGTFVTDADTGISNKITNLPLGSYTVKETVASKGHDIDPNTYPVTLTEANSSTTTPVVVESVEESFDDPVRIRIRKIDSEGNTKNGNSSLEGAQYTIWYFDDENLTLNTLPKKADGTYDYTRHWVLETKFISDADGYGCEFAEEFKVGGDDFYNNLQGEIVIPLGTVVIKETKAPEGYKVDGIFKDGNGNEVKNGEYIAYITEAGGIPTLSGGHEITSIEEVYRSDLMFTKRNYVTNEVMEGIPFRITSKTTGESHIYITDENGVLSTYNQHIAHDSNTNANDSLVPDANGMYSGLTMAGAWFIGNTSGDMSELDNTVGALPYDTYIVDELPCEANKGLQMITGVEYKIDGSEEIVDAGTFTNVPEPFIGTQVRDSETNTHYAVADDEVILVDTVDYNYLEANKTYTLVGILVDKETEMPLLDKAGNKIISAPTVFTTEKTYVKSKFEKCGSEDVTFTFDGTGMDGKTFVVYEYLYKGTITEADYDFIKDDGSLITTNEDKKLSNAVCFHAKITDANQTGYFPEVKTKAFSVETTTNTISNDDIVHIGDMVTIKNLIPGETYELKATLINKETGEIVKNENGEDLVSKPCVFTSNSTDTVQNVFFPAIKRELIAKENADIVVFEELIWKKSTGDIKYAEHTDINDLDQTLTLVTLETEASCNDEKIAPASKDITITDKVTYSNLTIGKEYTVEGFLMIKDTNDFLLDKDGNKITATKTFTATTKDGIEYLEFTFDATLLQGEQVVVFEYLYEEDIEVASHADINDEGQTVDFPSIGTSLKNEEGEPTAYLGKNITLIDTISYEKFIPGREYRIVGTLMNKDTGLPLKKDGVLSFITGETTFTPTEESGTVNVEFSFNAYEVGIIKEDGSISDIVCFEEVYFTEVNDEGEEEEILFAHHKDINAVSQTVEIVKPSVGTNLLNKDTGLPTSYMGTDITLIDTLSYKDFMPGVEYRIVGTLMNKDTGLPLMDCETKKFITAEAIFTPTTSSGTATVEFVFNPYNVNIIKEDGTVSDIVCFEKVYIVEDSKNEEKVEEILYCSHEDIEAQEQTVSFIVPSIGTILLDKDTKLPVTYMNSSVNLVDTLSYKNFMPGVEYRIVGTLMNKDTKLPLVDSETGKVVTVEKVFTPTKADGTVDMEFNLNVFNVGVIKEDGTVSDIVCFEKVYIVDKDKTEGAEEILYSRHEDIEAQEQTVTVPYGQTTAKDGVNGTHTGTPDEKAVIIDTVYYHNLIPGKTYTLKGKLWTKDENGKEIPFLDNGKEVVSEIEFTPTSEVGSIEMEFTFNASSLKGETITVFEDCYEEDKLVFTHSDIDDEGQQVSYPKIATEIKAKGGSKTLDPETKYTLIDTITYENLVVGETYVIEGVLMEKVEERDENGTVLSVKEKEYVNADGNKSTAVIEFTPTEANGAVDVGFEFYTSEDTYNKTFVCYERIYTKATHTEVCEHTDINDAKQSFTVTDQVRTGDGPLGIVMALMCFAIAGIIFIVVNKRKNKDIPLIKL